MIAFLNLVYFVSFVCFVVQIFASYSESDLPMPSIRIQRRLLERLSGPEPQPVAVTEAPDGLTTRETEVLLLIAEGFSNQEIARKLHVSTATVKTHINNLFAKTGLKDRAQAVRYAYAKGLARPPAQ